MDEEIPRLSQELKAQIEEAFDNFLETKSWPLSSAAERPVHDRVFSNNPEARKWKEPRRRVLLHSSNGSIVLGYHNENNDDVWATSSRGKDGGLDLYRDSWSVQDIVVGEVPGCIEYLEKLLNEDGTCGHAPLIQRTEYSEIPARLCFFSQWTDPDRGVNDAIFYVDTKTYVRNVIEKQSQGVSTSGALPTLIGTMKN